MQSLQDQQPVTRVLPASILAMLPQHVPRASLGNLALLNRQAVMTAQPEPQTWTKMQQQPVKTVNLAPTHLSPARGALVVSKELPTWMRTRAQNAKHVQRDTRQAKKVAR